MFKKLHSVYPTAESDSAVCIIQRSQGSVYIIYCEPIYSIKGGHYVGIKGVCTVYTVPFSLRENV